MRVSEYGYGLVFSVENENSLCAQSALECAYVMTDRSHPLISPAHAHTAVISLSLLFVFCLSTERVDASYYKAPLTTFKSRETTSENAWALFIILTIMPLCRQSLFKTVQYFFRYCRCNKKQLCVYMCA